MKKKTNFEKYFAKISLKKNVKLIQTFSQKLINLKKEKKP